ncbi:hypothetical protein JQN72_12935 [Phycicoccus sp. CSK15P-2]|uniref:hypothetical protein n=1 Tax=Phycicoccus sp. CSK15P-2 TaxID=2807627 RepID=UPI00194E7419|nr:hypothetical protein [Phycicoccus sp. CSK15P-2]MBM6405147.1 hypothetical protein [Phycicoccus sp. CSK15P-2]
MDETTETTSSEPLAVGHGLRRLVVADEDDGCVLGRPDLGRYVTVPPAGGAFVRSLQDHGDLVRATRAATEVAGEEVDGEDFVRALAGMGLLTDPEVDETRTRPLVTPGVAGVFFGRVAWCVYAVAVLGSLLAILSTPALRPGYSDVWFLRDKALSSLVVGLVGIALAGVHELWHWLAGRAEGLSGRFRVSRRGVFLVFETDLTEVVTMPRARRHGIYLAGMAVDSVILAMALLVEWLALSGSGGLPAGVGRFAAAVAFIKVVGIGQQWAMVFLRSDVYALLANLLGCHNLYRATWLTTKRRTVGLTTPESDELARIGEHDRAVAAWFGWVHLSGLVAVAAMVVFWVVPYLAGMVRWLVPVLARGDVGSGQFWTAAGLLTLTAVTWLTPVVVAVRERRLRLAGRLL